MGRKTENQIIDAMVGDEKGYEKRQRVVKSKRFSIVRILEFWFPWKT